MTKKNTSETAAAGGPETSAFRQQLADLAAKRIADHRELLEIKDDLLRQSLRLSQLGFVDVSGLVLKAAAKAAGTKPAKG